MSEEHYGCWLGPGLERFPAYLYQLSAAVIVPNSFCPAAIDCCGIWSKIHDFFSMLWKTSYKLSSEGEIIRIEREGAGVFEKLAVFPRADRRQNAKSNTELMAVVFSAFIHGAN